MKNIISRIGITSLRTKKKTERKYPERNEWNLKKLIALTAVLLCVQSPALAAEVDSTKPTITITGNTAFHLHEMPVFLLYPDYQFTDITDENTDQAVAYTNIVTTDQNGDYTANIPAGQDLPMGVYSFLAGAESTPVYFSPVREKQDATDVFCGQDAAALYTYLEDAQRYFCVTSGRQKFYEKYYSILSEAAKKQVADELSKFNRMTNKNDLESVLETIAALNAEFEKAVMPVFASSGFSAIRAQLTEDNVLEVLKAYNGAFGIDLAVLTDEDAAIGQKIRKEVYAGLCAHETLTAEEIEKICHTETALVKINSLTNRTAGTLRTILTTFQHVIGIDLTAGEFASLSESRQQQVFVKLAEKPDFEAIDAFKAAFETEVKNAGKPSGQTTGNGGNPSGGAPGAFVPQPPVETKEDVLDQPEKTGGFQDLEGYAWAAGSIAWLAENGIVAGVSETEFCPGNNVTREEFVKMVLAAFKIELINSEEIFEDVKPGSWYYHYVNTAQKTGIVSGVSETEFGVGREISRQDMAVMLVNAMDYIQKPLSEQDAEAFSDIDAVGAYAKPAVERLQKAQIIVGSDGKFNPDGAATRAEAAQIIYAAVHQ